MIGGVIHRGWLPGLPDQVTQRSLLEAKVATSYKRPIAAN